MDLIQVWCRTRNINWYSWATRDQEAVSSKWLQVQAQAKPHLRFQKHPSLWHESKEPRQKAALDIFPGIQAQTQRYEDPVFLVGSLCCRCPKMFLWWGAQASSPVGLRAFPVPFRICCSAVPDVSQATLAIWNTEQDNCPPWHSAANRNAARGRIVCQTPRSPPTILLSPTGRKSSTKLSWIKPSALRRLFRRSTNTISVLHPSQQETLF